MSEDIRKEPNSTVRSGPPPDLPGFADVDIGPPPPFPRSVAAAAVLWIILGLLPFLSLTVFLIYIVGTVPKANIGVGVGCTIIVGLIPCALGVVGLIAGATIIRGKAHDTLVDGIGSIFFALPFFGIGAFWQSAAARLPSGDPGFWPFEILTGAFALIGALLSVAGVLALIGRSGYKRWLIERKARLTHGRGPTIRITNE